MQLLQREYGVEEACLPRKRKTPIGVWKLVLKNPTTHLERGKLLGVWKLVLKNPTTQAHQRNSIPDNILSVLTSLSAKSRIYLANLGTERSKS